jgi:hypothetical protein
MTLTNNNLRGWLLVGLMAIASAAFAQAPAQPPAAGSPPAAEAPKAAAPTPPPPPATDKETVENPYASKRSGNKATSFRKAR